MIRERVAVVGQAPTHVVTAHWMIVENTGDVDVFVDTSGDALEADGPTGGLRVRPTEKVTIPRHRDDIAPSLFAAVTEGEGELTYYLPGWQ